MEKRDFNWEKGYEFKEVEKRWYDFWLERNLFHADENSADPPYSIVIPPPNVTGSLHMGHALNNTLQDILVRFRRMQGYNTLWLPGMDHAGIATQNVVEKQLAKEGLDRHALGRERFVERVWKWKEEYGGVIIEQLKRLGASCDWSRERFTMDEGLSEAVKEVFVRLYEDGLIYRDKYIINWCPRCQTALSDLEVEHEEIPAKLYHLVYPFEGLEGGIVVVTTRPETIMGDTAVAVNPNDTRYRDVVGKRVVLPVVKRRIPIIADGFVDPEFGSGALKITPAHDPHDFEIGLRHGLEMVKVIDDDGRMNREAGPYRGMDRFACRERIVEDLVRQGVLIKTEDYHHSVGHCQRCKTIVEPMVSTQWFVRIRPLAEKAIQAVQQGRTRIIPSMWEKTYFEWMENIKDWCISRQIWWGHRIPAWYCDQCGGITVSKTAPASCNVCGGSGFRAETDVLDTWFSSALWPFSTLGWPQRTKALEVFYPTSTLVTGFDILFFWVARMMMMGLRFMGDVPFRDVYIHALVRDFKGQKMSKSKGNVVDPLVMMERYGTDAFRFTLAALAAQGRDIILAEERIEGYRHFANKIWNASRFCLMNLKDWQPSGELPIPESISDRWILSRLDRVIGEEIRGLEEYRFNDAAQRIYRFVWHEFCDWYLEMIKPVLYGDSVDGERERTRTVLSHVLEVILKLLHPFMPFITEEIWQRMFWTEGSIMVAEFPKPDASRTDPAAEREIGWVREAVSAIRNMRGEFLVPPSERVRAVVVPSTAEGKELLERNRGLVENLARTSELEITLERTPPRRALTAVTGSLEVFMPLDRIRVMEERRRLEKEIERVDRDLMSVRGKLSNRAFRSKAPRAVVDKEEAKEQELGRRRERLEEGLRRLEDLD
ncbi:MAG: valine--tRNA ligase [Deltaproteobacteria bacterium]|nr:valine--tRNA ligase [Deltaproteobacteria bacterium]